MITLVIDRSSAQPSFALFEDKSLICTHTWQGEPTRAPEWMVDIRAKLAECHVPFSSITSYVSGLGPGSFSGIRACLAAMNGMALPTKTPVYGVASAAALACEQSEDLVTVVGDARRDRLWCVTYHNDKARARLTLLNGQTPSHTADDFQLVEAKKLSSIVPHETRIVSTDWCRLETLLKSQFEHSRLIQFPRYVSAEQLGRLALAEPAALKLEPSPIYLHPAV
ncbi:MAG: tRNA (adenosine(37)-N6)-threonylcarbamoyltransferase complex dimerization subunit type 1 TsaB [bacterium]